MLNLRVFFFNVFFSVFVLVATFFVFVFAHFEFRNIVCMMLMRIKVMYIFFLPF